MTNLILKATASDLEVVLHILSSCADWLSQQGMNHWNGAHTKERVMKRLQDNAVYLISDNGIPIGTITLSSNPPFYYNYTDDKFWKEPDASAIYISGLAVLPSHHGRGFATDLLSFAEDRTRESDIHYKVVGKRLTGNTESNFFEKEL